MFDPVQRLFADPLVARWCRGVTLRWWRRSRATARQTQAREEDARRETRQRRAVGADAVRGLLVGPRGRISDAIGSPEALARDLGVTTRFAEEHVARGVMVGAVVHAYLTWVIGECARVGARRVFFVSREGATLARAFNALARNCGGGNSVKAVYLPASRLSTFLPSLEDLSEASISRLWRQYPRQTLDQLLRNLSLPRDSFGPLAARHRLRLDVAIDDLAQLRDFFADPEIRDAFSTHRDRARDALAAYLARKGFFDDPVVAMGDVGWKGSIQTNIERAMRNWHGGAARSGGSRPVPPKVHGVYIALRRDPDVDTAPSTRVGFIVDEPASGVRDWESACVFRCGSMFEVALSVPHRCVERYGDPRGGDRGVRPQLLSDADPLFATLNAREREIFAGPSRLTRVACVRTLGVMALNAGAQGPLDPERARAWLVDALRREIVYPSRSSADSFLEHAHVETFGVFQPSRFDLVTPVSQILRGSPIHWPHRARVALEAHFWPDAIVRRSGVPLANLAFDLMLTRRARVG